MPEKDLTQRFSTKRRVAMVVESWNLSGEDLGRFLRKHGISSAELLSWREQMCDGLEEDKPLNRQLRKSLEQRIALLEKELEKARLQIELQKKVQNLVKDAEEKSTTPNSVPKSSKS